MQYPGKLIKPFHESDGFTLIELMIALVILAFGILGFLFLQGQAVQGRVFGREMSRATFVAQSNMEELLSMDFGHSLLSPGSHPTAGEGGTDALGTGTLVLTDTLGNFNYYTNWVIPALTNTNVKTIQAEVTTPQALTFLQLLVQLDHLIKGLDTLWMGGVIDDNQKSDGAYQWQRRLVKFTGQIRQLDAILKKGLKQTAEEPEEASKAHTEEKPEQNVAAPDSEPTAKEPPVSKKVAVA